MGKRRKRSWPELPEPLAGPIIDDHTYLPVYGGRIPGADGLKPPLGKQLSRAKATNTVGIISSACKIPSFDPTMQIARVYEGVCVAVAIHPNEAALHAGVAEPLPNSLVPCQAAHHVPLDEAIAKVERLLKDPPVVAVGESGLDYFRTAAQGCEVWKRSFATHLELDAEVGLSAQIHDRDAHADTLETLADVTRVDQLIVFHCFSGGAHLVRTPAEKGWCASSVGPPTYLANGDLRAALIIMPRELVLVEADVPYLTPASYQGSLNASYVMAHTVRLIAELWGVGEEEVCVQLMENTRCVYDTW